MLCFDGPAAAVVNDTYGTIHIRAGASSRNRLNLGLQVFALRRQVRSSFPHRATARWGPRIVSAPNPLTRLPLCPRGVMSSFARAGAALIVPSVGARDPLGPHAAPSNSLCTGRTPGRPVYRLSEYLPLNAVRATALGGPRIPENLSYNLVGAASPGGPFLRIYARPSPEKVAASPPI